MNANEIPQIGDEFELFENGDGKPIDRIKVIGTTQHPNGRLEIKTEGRKGKENDFCYQETSDSKKWYLLFPDPMTGDRCFSSRGPWYSLKPVQRN